MKIKLLTSKESLKKYIDQDISKMNIDELSLVYRYIVKEIIFKRSEVK